MYKALRDGVDPVAIKVFNDTNDDRVRQEFIQEIEILKGLAHPNIVQYLGIIQGPETMVLMTEFMDGGDLYHALKGEAGSGDKGEYQWHNR